MPAPLSCAVCGAYISSLQPMNWFYEIDENGDATEKMVFTHANRCAEEFRRTIQPDEAG